MKIKLDTALLFIDLAIAGFILAHLSLELNVAIIVVTGIVAIFGHDYGRKAKSLAMRHSATPFPTETGENLPLAG